MWELDHKESWVPKNWCFWTVVLENTLESPLDCKIQPSILKEISPEYSLKYEADVEAEAPILWPHDGKNRLIRKDPEARKDWRREEKGMTENKMVGWHHQFNGHEFVQTPGDGEGQESLACCSPWHLKESDMTEWLTKQQLLAIHRKSLQTSGTNNFQVNEWIYE